MSKVVVASGRRGAVVLRVGNDTYETKEGDSIVLHFELVILIDRLLIFLDVLAFQSNCAEFL